MRHRFRTTAARAFLFPFAAVLATKRGNAILGVDEASAQSSGTDTRTVTVSSGDGLPIDTMLMAFAAITVVWVLLAVLIMRRQRARRNRPLGVLQARPRQGRRASAAAETGSFVPLARVAREPADAPPGPVAPLAPPHEHEPAGPFRAFDRRPVAEPVADELPEPAREPLGEATTYEIVWYREDSRLVFALQPIDGRSAPGTRRRSDHFTWTEDADPPADLRGAQSAHGRLRALLVRGGWRPAGRGRSWFSHRFHPPPRQEVKRRSRPARGAPGT
jgi:hypothetical protein